MLERCKVSVENLKASYDLESIGFETTEELEPLTGIIGQQRAVKALEFGLQTGKKGYNIFVTGLSGTGRNSYVQHLTNEKAKTKNVPEDWVYVFNFRDPNKPIAINLYTGDGKRFRDEVERMITNLKKDIENAFTSKNYESMKSVLYKQYDDESEKLINELNEIAAQFDFKFVQTEKGIISTPLINGEPMKEEDYKSLSREAYEKLREKSSALALETVDVFNQIKDLEEEYHEKLKKLENEVGTKTVNIYIDRIKAKFVYSKKAMDYFDRLKEDVIENISKFKDDDNASKNPLAIFQASSSEAFFKRYQVNLFIDNSNKKSAPIIIENNPTYKNLIGSIDYKTEMGVAKTDFTYIKPGSLHLANGGYIIMQASEVLTSPFAWDGLLRALITDQVSIESVESNYGFASHLAIKPEPIPLKIKVIIIGSPNIHSLLFHHDEKFRKLFKITADFDTEMTNNEDNIVKMARFITANACKEGLKHFDKYAVNRIVEYSSRLTSNQKKLTARFSKIMDILCEADAWADYDDSKIIELKHVEKAIEEKIYRSNRYEEKVLELFKDEDLLLDIEGERVGEINGLAVIGINDYTFGKPSKITVSTYKGRAGLINIEREAHISGNIHDKGVMIINGYLGHKYAQDKPLTLSASIVFEQSYSGVDGDSASSTELYAILSSLAEVPIKQYIAVTGSVNQRGEIQPIGGVNEKIEGYFKICKQKGLTGNQGVMIPHQNVKNLMLNEEVIDAVKAKQFNIYAIKDIDEGIEILTGIPAGKKNARGNYPKGTIHNLANAKLKKYAESMAKVTAKRKTKKESE